MKRFLFLAILSLMGFAAMAQSKMTDEHVKNYIVKEYQSGKSEQDIVGDLLSKGATISQIQKAKDSLMKQKQAMQQASEDKPASIRLRKHLKQEEEEVVDSLDLFVKQEQPEIKIFGQDIFANKNLMFESEINIATPLDYVIGAGDVVVIDVWGASQNTFDSTVSPEGEIVVEGVGPIAVGGLTVEQANKRVKAALGKFYASSKIKLTVGQTKAITVNIMGEVEHPGTYTLSAFSTVFHALYQAGGTTNIGTLRNIKVYRQNKLVSTVDVYDYLLNGTLIGNVSLQSDDVIIVGTYENLVQAEGMVKRPMYYEMKGNETVALLLAYAGGFTDAAYTENVRITRKEQGKLSVYTLNEVKRSTFELKNGDVLTVDGVLDRYNNMVAIRGAIKHPGRYQIGEDIKTFKQLIEVAGGFREDALLSRALLHRRKADRSVEVIAVDLEKLMNGSIADIVIKNEDELYIHSREAEIDALELYIYGEIMMPGAYDYAENMTIEDLILTAGGLQDAASLTRIDVARRIRDNISNEATGAVSEMFTFSIKEGLVIEGDKQFTLQPFDEVYVRKSPNYIAQEHIIVKGEANFPGTYAITKRNYRLSDLINAAGGLTKGAYLEGARLERKLTADELQQQRDILKALNDSVDVDKLDLKSTKYVGISLKEAMAHPGSDFYDVVLQDGDIINIPQMNNTITIRGEVLYPNTVVYQDDKNLKYYIEQAGGYTDKAKKKNVYAVNMDGTVTIVKKAKDIKPGAQIVVPTKEEREKLNFTQYISIFTTIAMMGSVIATLLK